MRKNTLWLALLLITTGSFMPQISIRTKTVMQSASNELIAAVNSLRIANGLPPYNSHPILMQTAQEHADYMAATGSVTHFGPNGERPFQRALNAGYPVAGDLSLGGFYSENILAGRYTPEAAVQIWQGDGPHLNTMLSPTLQDIGAGVTKVGEFVYYVIDAGLASSSPVKFTPGPQDGTPGTSDTSQFIVPVVSSLPDESGSVYHEVQSGQSLWAIAIAYGTTIDEIRSLNNLQVDAPIYPGDRLLIRIEEGLTHAEKTDLPLSTVMPTMGKTQESLSKPASNTESVLHQEQPLPASETSNSIGIIVGIILVALLIAGLLTWLLVNKSEQ